MTNGARPCPICKWDAGIQRAGNRDVFEIECRRCGRFVMSGTLLSVMERLNADDQRLLPYLSAHTRQATENGILTGLNTDNWQDLARAHTRTSVSQKIRKLLEHLEAHSIGLGIRPAVTECGFDPVRIDRVHHNEKICDKILAEIRLSQFVVADFTLQRAGVYFEAGFGMGLGRPVIWVCRDNDFENTHFDTRQYNHIVWSTPDDLRAKLADRIRATVPR